MPRILVIDDDHALLRAWEVRLASANFMVVTCSDPLAAITTAEQFGPEIILLDIRMPGADGYEVCRRLKSHSALQSIPVVFMSANLGPEPRRQALEAGGAEFMEKPLVAVQVLAVLNRVLASVDHKKGDLDAHLEVPVHSDH